MIATCICPMSENLIFLGSRLGDSILVHLAEGDIPIVQNDNHSEADSPPQKLLKLVNCMFDDHRSAIIIMNTYFDHSS